MTEELVILGSALSLCLAVIGFLIKREIDKRDETEKKWNDLVARWEGSLHTVTLSLSELNSNLRTWTAEQFVRRTEHEKDMERLRSDTYARIEQTEDHFQRDIEVHKLTCKKG